MRALPELVWCEYNQEVHEDIPDPYGQIGEIPGYAGCASSQQPVYVDEDESHV